MPTSVPVCCFFFKKERNVLHSLIEDVSVFSNSLINTIELYGCLNSLFMKESRVL